MSKIKILVGVYPRTPLKGEEERREERKGGRRGKKRRRMEGGKGKGCVMAIGG